MIPLKDDNPTRRTPFLTLLLIAACVFTYFGVQQQQGDAQDEFTFRNAAIPCEVVQGRPLTVEETTETLNGTDDTACRSEPADQAVFPDKSPWFAVLVSMFLHGGLLHLGGNMLYLWVFGNNIEDTFGRVGFIVFYLLSGLAATLAHVALQPDSTIPIVGASGAIAGVMGAYLVLFPRARIKSLITLGFFILFRDVPAWLLLGIWLVSQFFINPNSGVAWVAHVGGFVFGVAIALVYRAIRGTRARPSYVNSPFGF